MPFFPPLEDAPEPEEPQEWSPPVWMQPPADVLPGIVGLNRVIARGERDVLVLSRLEVYPDGVDFVIRGDSRRGDDESAADWERRAERFGVGAYAGSAGFARFGLALADGTSALADFPFHQHLDERPEPPRLSNRGPSGGGGTRRRTYKWHLWLWPIPPPGPIDLVTEWLDAGIHETRVALDGDLVSQARTLSRPLWG